MTAFRVGDVVEWTSQSAGVVKRKRGEVIALLKPGEWLSGPRRIRDHVSYVVRVREPYLQRSRLYWPRVPQLALASPMDAEQGGAK